MILILMGVSGSGKTTVGKVLANELGWLFYDADENHPASNIEKMAKAIPLTDADREPWLKSLRELIEALIHQGRSAVLACSALKKSYRHILSDGLNEVRFAFLNVDVSVVQERLLKRKGHFMGPELLKSQFDTLEVPEDAIIVEATQTPEAIASSIAQKL